METAWDISTAIITAGLIALNAWQHNVLWTWIFSVLGVLYMISLIMLQEKS